MMDYFNDNIYNFWFLVGFVLLVIEALAFGFSTGFILFVGLGALLTGGLLWLAVVPATWMASIATFSLSSVVVSALLWKSLKRLQNDKPSPLKDNSSDLIGLTFRLDNELTTTSPTTTRYSGIEWKVEIDFMSEEDVISPGSVVSVVSVDAGKFRVVLKKPD